MLDAPGRDPGGMREGGVQVPPALIMQDNIPISRSSFNHLCRIPLASKVAIIGSGDWDKDIPRVEVATPVKRNWLDLPLCLNQWFYI